MMKNSSRKDEYPAMQSNGPLPQVLIVGTDPGTQQMRWGKV